MTNISNCPRIRIADLIKSGVLRCDNEPKHINLSWNKGESQISATVDTSKGRITFDYLCNGQPIHYSIDIEKRTANIGFGDVYFFRLMRQGKAIYCKNLYLYNGLFVPRVMIPDAMYGIQIENKSVRAAIYDKEPFRKYGKTHYNGKLTAYGRRINKFYEHEDKAGIALCKLVGLI